LYAALQFSAYHILQMPQRRIKVRPHYYPLRPYRLLRFCCDNIQICLQVKSRVHWISNHCRLIVSIDFEARDTIFLIVTEIELGIRSCSSNCQMLSNGECLNVPSPLSVFFSAGMCFLLYSAFAFSIKLFLCSYSRLIAESFAEAVREAW
jgi:hypothetical protein